MHPWSIAQGPDDDLPAPGQQFAQFGAGCFRGVELVGIRKLDIHRGFFIIRLIMTSALVLLIMQTLFGLNMILKPVVSIVYLIVSGPGMIRPHQIVRSGKCRLKSIFAWIIKMLGFGRLLLSH
ncbi:hypothetical protein L2E82_30088 [Cichorium intybus]|uniref:Uncharacterized protein n=1 Tax=Cichorium intybus TaxID=13427 RepID=A0ACB9D031_CICIN|nr:hypothetical protein L2E82_30088 [Cichorium intybus]